jgi:hypothetical protein
VFKLLVLFAHVLGTSLALGAIVATDLRLVGKLADHRVRIAPPNPYVMRLITIALGVLYATGALLITLNWLDDPRSIVNPKLQAKLLLVLLLTLNAVVLHRYTFPSLARGRSVSRWKARDYLRVAVPVGLSNCLWMYCAFLGIARPWNHTVSIAFVLGHAAWLFALVLAGIVTLLAIAGQDRTGRAPGFIDALKKRLGSVAAALLV